MRERGLAACDGGMAGVTPPRPDDKKVLFAQEQTRPDVVAARRQWRELQPTWAVSRLVFLDESGFATHLARRWGWAPRGQRYVGHVPYGHWQSTTFVGALRATGLTAPLVLDGPLTTDAFRASVTQLLVPTLRPGDLVILDNLTVHKDPLSAQQVEHTRATLRFLPPSSPDLNPIELVFAKLKALARAAALRSREALWTYLGAALAYVSPLECLHYFHQCGSTES